MEDISIVWSKVLEKIKLRVSSVSFMLWIKKVKPIEINNDQFILQVTSDVRKVLIRDFIDEIGDCCFEILKKPIEIVILEAKTTPYDAGKLRKINPLIVEYDQNFNIESLLKRIGIEKTNSKVKLISCEQFLNEYIDSTYTSKNFQNDFSKFDVLILQEFEFLNNKMEVQSELLLILNKMIVDGKQLIFTLNKSADLCGIDLKLKTRFASGMIVEIGGNENG